MHSIKLRSHVGPDGVLKLEVPVGLNDVDLDIVLVLQPVERARSGQSAGGAGWPAGFFEQTAGGWAGEPLVRESQGEYEVRKPLE